MNERRVLASDLVPCDDARPVECIGGPQDGEMRPANENGARQNGLYVVENDASNRVIARIYVPPAHSV